MKRPATYMTANERNGTIYTGVTSALEQRVSHHKNKTVPGFSKKYGCDRLVWFEIHDSMEQAILREKQIKAGSRKKKIALIEAMNPTWKDLFDDLF